MLQHISLEQLQGLNSGEKFWASFSPTSPAYEYEMVEDVRSYVTYRSHLVTGSWQGELGCGGVCMGRDTLSPNEICEECHHRVGNHPKCEQRSYLVVICGGKHVRA